MSTKYSLKKDAQKTALDTKRVSTGKYNIEACNTGKVDKIAKCITISNDEDDVYSSADKDKIMYIYNSHDSDNDNDSDDNNSENSYANSNEDSDANNEDSNDDDEDDDEDEEDNIDDNYYAYNNHYTGETNSVQDSILELYAPWLTRDATQTPETLEKFYKIKLEGFGWGLPIKTQVLSSKHFDFEYESNIEMQSLIHFIQNGILDSQTAVDSKVKQLAGLHYWQYPAEQPSPAQSMAVLQGMAGGQKTNDFIKVKVKRLEAAKVTWWRAFDTLITHYKTNENSYFYYIGRHMTVLFSANKSLLQDCLAAHGVRYMVALVTTHATGLANYLQKHDINYRRLEKESGSEAFRPARRNSNNEELLLVDDLDSLESLIDLAHEWDAHPSYARQSCLPHLVSPIPFLNASIGKAQVSLLQIHMNCINTYVFTTRSETKRRS
ncbi:hypothetical protein BDF19DRAFT_323824 [Syncephalis fuscata]|nr:hypothetical protein BDF19DRAFT_323824 [Syncephalis fuscata]